MGNKRLFAFVMAVVLVVTTSIVYAQGIQDRLGAIGRAALEGATEEGLSQVEDVVGTQQSAPPSPSQVAVIPVAESDTDVIEVTRSQLIAGGIIGFLCLVIIALYYRQGQRPPTPPSTSILGNPDVKPDGPDPMQTYRLAAVKRLFIITFLSSIFVQTLEVFAEAFLPGFQTTLNVAHLFLLALSALWASVWVVFGPYDQHVQPRIKWYELLTGETYGTAPAGWKPMHVAIRCTLIGGTIYLLVELMKTIAFGIG